MITNDPLKLSTITFAAISFIAYMKQFIFYQYFGIDISNYTHFSDLLTPFIDDLAINLGILLVSLITAYSFKSESKEKEAINATATSNKGYVIIVLDFIYDNFVLIMLLVCFFSLGSIMFRLVGFTKMFFHTVGAMLVIATYMWFVKKTSILNDIGLTDFWQRAAFLVVVHIVLVSLLTINFEVVKVQKYIGIKNQYTFKMRDDSFINTDSNSIYLGRTTSNFFIFRKELNHVYIYKIDDLVIEKVKQ